VTTAIEINAVQKRFGNVAIIRDLDLRVAQGERHAIIGPNGAGKSTTFNLISGHIKPTSGEIRLNGDIISGLRPFEINRRGLSRSFQVTNVFAKMTVWENVRCAVLWATGHRYAFWKNVDHLPEVKRRTAEILDDIHLSHRRDVPAGLLTYAEQRELEIGITVAGGANVIMLDEPTAGMSVVFGLADRISVLVYGNIIASGTPQEIRANPKVREAYLGEEAH
jgi:branched-chain amino acid transport system ATP-binding protein